MAEIIMPVNAGSPSTPSSGSVSLYPKNDSRFYVKDSTGAEVKLLTNESVISDLTVALPLTSSGGSSPTISINEATTLSAGILSASDKTKLNNSTHNNINNALVQRDGNGNINVTRVTGNLSGTATTCQTIPQLSGHVTSDGTSNQISLSEQVITNSHIAIGAAIELSKLATNPLNRSNHTGTQTSSTISDFSTAVDTKIEDYLEQGVITESMFASDATISISKLATNPLSRSNHTGTQASTTISDFEDAVNDIITPGSGIVKSGTDFNVVGTTNRISVSSDSIDISSNYIGQTSITTLGTVILGAWQADTIALESGGTGATTAARAATNLRNITSISAATFNLTSDHQYVLVNSTNGNRVLTLPSATSSAKVMYVIKKVSSDSNTVSIATSGSDTIEGNSSHTLSTQYQTLKVISDGNLWYIIN